MAPGLSGNCGSTGTLVSFYSHGTHQDHEALRLEASAARLSLPVMLEPVHAGARERTPQILNRIRARLRGPLLYAATDAVLNADPWTSIPAMGADVAVYPADPAHLLFLADTPAAIRLLEAWSAGLDHDPALTEGQALDLALQHDAGPGSPACVIGRLPEALALASGQSAPPVEFLPAVLHDDAAGGRENLALRAARLWRIAEVEESLGLLSADPDDSAAPSPEAVYAEQPAADRNARTTELIAAGHSDVSRWSVSANLKSAWSGRAAMAAGIIGAASPVLDLGCGKMDVEAFLPKETIYLPADIVPRDARTLACDLNRSIFPSRHAEVVLMLGVLEYVHDCARLFVELARRWRRVVISYNPADLDRDRDRRAHGWFNDLASAELVALAARAGYGLHLHCAVDHRQRFYDFRLP